MKLYVTIMAIINVILIFVLTIDIVRADERHIHDIVLQPTTNVSNTYIQEPDYAGTAISVAMAQHHFNPNNPKPQMSVGIGNYESINAGSVSLAGHICSKCGNALLSASASAAGGGKYAVGAGLSWSFK